MLDLSPETENRLRQYAHSEGVSVNALINRYFPPMRVQPEKNIEGVPADDPVLLFLNTRLAEAEAATPEEVALADAQYRHWQQNMNETRRVTGERLLFPEAG